jgi:5-methyltetrahydropteroyltriglutamate--homocysteine methyltransferase
MADDFGYHIDHHGSLVRPPQLLAARAAGLSGEELAAVTDEAVVALAHALRPADPERHVRRAVPAGAALGAILRDEIAALAADGVLYVALENPLYAPLLTVDGRVAAAAAGVDVPAALAALIEADRAVFAGLGVPAEFRVGLDLTDSGPLATTASGYDATAVAALLDETPFPRISVDYPADPAARFPVELVKPGIVVSLGAVDVSTAAFESVEEILGRIDPVADERGDADIAVATNGGFAQVADQPLMSEPEQRAKLQLVEMVARYYWGNEI